MKQNVRAMALLLSALLGCSDSILAPPYDDVPNTPAPPPPPGYPPIPQPATVESIYDRVSASTWIRGAISRFVLYQDGMFSLQFVTPAFGFFEYPGRYSRDNSLLRFVFDANNGSWQADGILRSDSLEVGFNEAMQWNDFEGGLYRKR